MWQILLKKGLVWRPESGRLPSGLSVRRVGDRLIVGLPTGAFAIEVLVVCVKFSKRGVKKGWEKGEAYS